MSLTVQTSVRDRIIEAQLEAVADPEFLKAELPGLDKQLEKKGDSGLYFVDRIWVPSCSGVRALILEEAHRSRYSVHPGADKIYFDLRELYWWPGMKKDIAVFVSQCLTCLQVKAEHQKPSGLLEQPQIPEWKWERITMDSNAGRYAQSLCN